MTLVDVRTAPRPLLPLPRRTCRVLRTIAVVWSLAMVLLLALSSRFEVLDARPGGNAFELRAKPILMVFFALGALLAWRWEILGGVVAAFSAAGLSAFAFGQLERPSALFVLMGFVIPGALWIVLDLHDQRPRRAVIALAVVGVAITAGAYTSYRIYDDIYGPSHPSSSTPTLPDSALEWVWSGGVTTHEATVVAKVDHGGIKAKLIVSDNADLRAPLPTPIAVADEHGIVRMPVDGLDASTQYHYAVEVDGQVDLVRTGQFRTFADGPQSLTVAVGSCARVGSNGAVFDTIRGLDPDLFLIDGDWNYANISDGDPNEFREVLDYTMTRSAQSALYRSTPVAYVWDDHDYGGDNADATSPTRWASMAVYREYAPHYPLAGDDAPIYQAFTVGRVRFLITDTRSSRAPSSAPDDENKTMLGSEQKAWLERELLVADDDYALTVWVNPTPWVGEASEGSDTWAGYSTERREISDFIAAHDIDRLVMLSGDAHMVAIDDGTNTDYSTGGGAGFPLLHGAALDRPGKIKGGPYSGGAIAGGGQFGVLQVDDDGTAVHVSLSGRDWRNEILLAYDFTLPPRVTGATSG
jgi:phosphodiesterase/alkaline phosphatase D-like protein